MKQVERQPACDPRTISSVYSRFVNDHKDIALRGKFKSNQFLCLPKIVASPSQRTNILLFLAAILFYDSHSSDIVFVDKKEILSTKKRHNFHCRSRNLKNSDEVIGGHVVVKNYDQSKVHVRGCTIEYRTIHLWQENVILPIWDLNLPCSKIILNYCGKELRLTCTFFLSG